MIYLAHFTKLYNYHWYNHPVSPGSYTKNFSMLKTIYFCICTKKIESWKSFLSATAPQLNGEDTVWIVLVPGAD